MTATWSAICIDCPDAKALATFYAALSGLEHHEYEGGYHAVGDENSILILMEEVENYQAPTWPTQERGQQMHLCFRVADLDQGVQDAEALGATLAAEQPGSFWKVMLDPAGHPFCLSKSE